MSRAARAERFDTDRARASARLGLTLRSVLLAPTDGFAAAVRATERRERAGSRPAEGFAPYILAAAGGAALTGLWLKLGAIAGLREICSPNYIGGYIAASLVLGALLALVAQTIWGAAGSGTINALHGETRARDLRMVWGAAAFPQVFPLAILLPLDLIIVGTDSFTTSQLGDSLSTAWAAFSLALGVAFAAWSLYLFVKGVQVVGGVSTGRALVGALVAVACVAVVVGALFGVSMLTPEGASCPT